jgi:hypothetical protein
VRAAPNWEMAVDWWVSPRGGGDGDDGGRRRTGDLIDPGVRGRRTESRVDGEGGDVLECGCEEVERRGERDDSRRFERARARGDEGKRRAGRLGAAWGQERSGGGGVGCGAA